MKNGVECYKDFFPYFKALKTNCENGESFWNPNAYGLKSYFPGVATILQLMYASRFLQKKDHKFCASKKVLCLSAIRLLPQFYN